jgi:hypothetical protein
LQEFSPAAMVPSGITISVRIVETSTPNNNEIAKKWIDTLLHKNNNDKIDTSNLLKSEDKS